MPSEALRFRAKLEITGDLVEAHRAGALRASALRLLPRLMRRSATFRDSSGDMLIHLRPHWKVAQGYVAPPFRIPSEIGAHFRAQANFSARSSFFNAASALSASDLLAKACVPSTRTGGLERVNFAPLPLL
jgi:hypothetical protein